MTPSFSTFFFTFILSLPLFAANYSKDKVRTLYSGLNPKSAAEHLAFSELFPDTEEGKKARQEAFLLLNGGKEDFFNYQGSLNISLTPLISVFCGHNDSTNNTFDEASLKTIAELSKRLPNNKLKGKKAISEEEVLKLASDEIDLSHAICLSLFENDPDAQSKIAAYEATLDLMALDILAKLPDNATAKDKIRAINQLIFFDLGFRFPAHSTYSENIDLYTFLPSVLDSRRGVCLGVSILYCCLADRLSLPLEMITPPGHIYVRYRKGNEIVNIETTARGIDLDSEIYLGVDTKDLHARTKKEMTGLAYMNQAAVYLGAMQIQKAFDTYQKAHLYIKDDVLLDFFTGCAALAMPDNLEMQQIGKQLFEKVRGKKPEGSISTIDTVDDYLEGKVDGESLKVLFKHVDETRESIEAKKDETLAILEKFPNFREGWKQLGSCWLQLDRMAEALEAFEKVYPLSRNDAELNYYLSSLYLERFNYPKAWAHLLEAERLTKQENHFPKALLELRKQLSRASPEPLPVTQL